VTGQKDEEVALGTREIYVCYPVGIGKSKLRITGRRNFGDDLSRPQPGGQHLAIVSSATRFCSSLV
jgi:hypothetical protein